MKTQILSQLQTYSIENFKVDTLVIESSILASNPLGDSSHRYIPVLTPKDGLGPYPVVLVLAGFTGNAPAYFNSKFMEPNAIQVLDQAFGERMAPHAIYAFIDAMTTWGGSQFINSSAVGDYHSHIIEEVIPALRSHFPVRTEPEFWAVTGGSSGGYGSLHLASAHPEIFGVAAAIAPDCYFEVSLLNDLFLAAPLWEKYHGKGLEVLSALRGGQLKKNKNFHSVLNAFAMSACYSPKGSKGDFYFPIDTETGALIPEVWDQWKLKDPLVFLEERGFYKTKTALMLDVGNRDQFHLQYGARQLHQQMKRNHFKHQYSEFDGTHFEISERRVLVWKWLQELWN